MKKAVLVVAWLIACGSTGWFVFQTISATSGPGGPGGLWQEDAITEVSPKTAAGLQVKIDRIKQSEEEAKKDRAPETMAVYEAELESYVLYALREDIPVQLDSFDVQLSPGIIAT